MNMGPNFSEILVILVLILLFFGTKELPQLIRQAAQFVSKMRLYGDKVRREFNEISKINEPMPSYEDEAAKKKNVLRSTHAAAVQRLTTAERDEKSAALWNIVKTDAAFVKAKTVMLYANTEFEVQTIRFAPEIISLGKRIILPYVQEGSLLGIAEVQNMDSDLVKGAFDILEPRPALRDNFLKSDIQLVICPCVAFDRYGARVGHGKGYYDKFTKELKGRVPIIGIAFDCQIMPENERVPFAYHDIIMDQVITESGYVLKKPEINIG